LYFIHQPDPPLCCLITSALRDSNSSVLFENGICFCEHSSHSTQPISRSSATEGQTPDWTPWNSSSAKHREGEVPSWTMRTSPHTFHYSCDHSKFEKRLMPPPPTHRIMLSLLFLQTHPTMRHHQYKTHHPVSAVRSNTAHYLPHLHLLRHPAPRPLTFLHSGQQDPALRHQTFHPPLLLPLR
jgi:hypothetical protein